MTNSEGKWTLPTLAVWEAAVCRSVGLLEAEPVVTREDRSLTKLEVMMTMMMTFTPNLF
jgi:hypothetical protein